MTVKPNRDDPERNVHWEICCDDHENDVYSVWSPTREWIGPQGDEADDFDWDAVEWDDMFGESINSKLISGTQVECLQFLLALAQLSA